MTKEEALEMLNEMYDAYLERVPAYRADKALKYFESLIRAFEIRNDLERKMTNIQKDVTKILSIVCDSRQVLKTVNVRKQRDSEGNLECPICGHDVPKECGECEMCGQKLVWGY